MTYAYKLRGYIRNKKENYSIPFGRPHSLPSKYTCKHILGCCSEGQHHTRDAECFGHGRHGRLPLLEERFAGDRDSRCLLCRDNPAGEIALFLLSTP